MTATNVQFVFGETLTTTAAPTPLDWSAKALVLAGGGARAAYQIGVLNALTRIRRDCQGVAGNPFDVIAGTSAGAINAAALACRADDFDAAVQTLLDRYGITDPTAGNGIGGDLFAIVWSAVVSAIALLICKFTVGLRVTEEQESEGLDISEHGETAYHD